MKQLKELIKLIIFSIKLSIKVSAPLTAFRFASSIFAPAIPMITSYCIAQIINNLTYASDSGYHTLIYFFLTLLSMQLLSSILNRLGEYIVSVHNDKIQHYINIMFSEKSINVDISLFDSTEYYDIFSNAQRDSGAILVFLFQSIQTISSSISLVVSFYILSRINILMSVFMLIASVPSILVNKKLTKKLFDWQNNNMVQQREMNYSYQLMTSRKNAQDVRFYDTGNYLLKKFKSTWEKWYSEYRNILKSRTYKTLIIDIIPIIVSFIFLFLLGMDIFKGNRSPGDFVFYQSQLQTYHSAILLTISCGVSLYDNKLKVTNMEKFFSLENNIITGDLHIDEFWKLEFSNVSFSYPLTEKKVLNNISFTINKGDKLALVGVNGSGKTTLIKLILRFYDPTEGEILLNSLPSIA